MNKIFKEIPIGTWFSVFGLIELVKLRPSLAGMGQIRLKIDAYEKVRVLSEDVWRLKDIPLGKRFRSKGITYRFVDMLDAKGKYTHICYNYTTGRFVKMQPSRIVEPV